MYTILLALCDPLLCLSYPSDIALATKLLNCFSFLFFGFDLIIYTFFSFFFSFQFVQNNHKSIEPKLKLKSNQVPTMHSLKPTNIKPYEAVLYDVTQQLTIAGEGGWLQFCFTNGFT